MTQPDPRSQQDNTQRLGELVGDRLCAKCCFNLSGQTIIREPHYQLLIVRCPECGTPAALQEYPLLGRWANRVGYIFAGLVVLTMIGSILISSFINWGFCEGMTDSLTSRYGMHIQQAYQAQAANAGPQPNNPYMSFDQQWWTSVDQWAMFRDAGSWSGAIDWRGLLIAIPQVLVLGAVGVFLSVVGPNLRSWKCVIPPLLVFIFSGLFVIMAYSTNSWYYYGGMAARYQLLPYLGPMVLAIGALAMLVGLLVGRTMARWIVIIFLPPRLRGPAGYLWRADGKAMPRTTR